MARPRKAQPAAQPRDSGVASVGGNDAHQVLAPAESGFYHAPAFQYPGYELNHANAAVEQVSIANEVDPNWPCYNSHSLQEKDPLSNVYSGPYPLLFGGPSSSKEAPEAGQLQALSLPYGPSEPPPLDISPPESSSSAISWAPSMTEVLSPTQTEDFLMQGHNMWTRQPSPLMYPIKPASTVSNGSTLWNGMRTKPSHMNLDGSTTVPRKEAGHLANGTPSLMCRWNENGPCRSGSFANREELNWHVKMEHLLECPVLGCVEGSFSNKELLDCHVRWGHKSARLDDVTTTITQVGNVETDRTQASLIRKKTEMEKPPAIAGPAQDRLLKMEMSIGISKRRCREKLRGALEKKFRRQTGVVGPAKLAESPRTPRLFEHASFPLVWEHGVLPFLIEFVPKWCGPGHVISVTRGKKRDMRRICLMTKKPVSKARKMTIAAHVRDLLPETYRHGISFAFTTGEVDRLTWARGLSRQMPDEVCNPRNPFCYSNPCMGDSIGAVLQDGDDTTATLGPKIIVGGGNYWLANFHPFEETNIAGDMAFVLHPSPADRDQCREEGHEALESDDLDFELGKIAAKSGYDLKTTRITHEPYWEDLDMEPPLVVTDWALISAKTREANLLRKFPTGAAPKKEVPITRMSSVVPGADVCSTGRTSGYQRGQVCEIPAYVDGKNSGNGTGKGTREWFIEEPESQDDEDEWIRGGIGVPGDSGAAVIDCETHMLIGQLWGRNKYHGAGSRVTYFTPMFDIFDDIQEKCGEQTRPQLPQYRDEADRWPVYPVCRTCYDLREYMESRRSSRESLVSMIAGAGEGSHSEHDLTSVSELATPKANTDNHHWTRYAGLDDVMSSFNSAISPAPMASYSASLGFAANSPGIVEMRSPYAMTLNDEDLFETRCPDERNSGHGKRKFGSTALVRSNSHQSGTYQPEKRRRVM
ncbi:hypothetical protein PG993_009284 [Apiospora rasikravindrae]|uniref:C2H2-type domain-containing protein n=1 Tax=Apiospora rasikravindrae TaxID=990691 RepID=A0ABR1SIY8_9PEZI